jgi:hypothetical protein
VAQAQVLGILSEVYAFMYAFLIKTVAVSQLHKQLAETKDIEMARKANGQGHTYKVGNSYRTVIRKGDHCITAMAATAQEFSLMPIQVFNQRGTVGIGLTQYF